MQLCNGSLRKRVQLCIFNCIKIMIPGTKEPDAAYSSAAKIIPGK